MVDVPIRTTTQRRVDRLAQRRRAEQRPLTLLPPTPIPTPEQPVPPPIGGGVPVQPPPAREPSRFERIVSPVIEPLARLQEATRFESPVPLIPTPFGDLTAEQAFNIPLDISAEVLRRGLTAQGQPLQTIPQLLMGDVERARELQQSFQQLPLEQQLAFGALPELVAGGITGAARRAPGALARALPAGAAEEAAESLTVQTRRQAQQTFERLQGVSRAPTPLPVGAAPTRPVPPSRVEPPLGTPRMEAVAELPSPSPGQPPPPPSPPVGHSAVPPPDDNPVHRLTQVIRAAGPARETTEELRARVRRQQAGALSAIQSRGEGRSGFLKSAASLRGELPTAEFESVANQFTPDEVSQLHRTIQLSNARPFDRFTAEAALEKALTGQLPQRSELALLQRIFNETAGEGAGDELVNALLSQRPFGQRVLDNFLDAINLPRALVTSFDVSAALRQGAVLSVSHPREWLNAVTPMIRAMASETYTQSVDDALRARPLFRLADESGLFLAERGVGNLSSREELFVSRLASRIPGIRVSERGFVTFLNKLRADVFDTVASQWAGQGKTAQDFRELALYLNRATGRGGLGPLERSLPILNAAFFSPRFFSSRVTLPLSLLTSTPAVRRLVARDLALFVGTGISILSLLSLSGAADVELDPRSSDFGKIRIGRTRLDFWAGFQPLVRYTTQLLTNERKATGTGDIVGVDRDTVVGRFIQSKLSPQAGFAVEVLRGETFTGDELTLEPASIREQAIENLAPLFIQDVREGIREQGLAGGFLSLPSGLGVGFQAFAGFRDRQNEASRQMFSGREFVDLNVGERRRVDESSAIQEARRTLEDRGRTDPRQRTSFAVQTWNRRKVELESPVSQSLAAGIPPGAALRELISDMKQNRFQLSDALFDAEVSNTLAGSQSTRPEDILAEQYWSATLPFNPATGELDFSIREQQRQAILSMADYMGISRDYIAGSGPGTYRGIRFENPQVRAVVESLESDQELLRPYWEVNQNLPQSLNLDPTLTRLWEQFLSSSRETQSLLRAQFPVLSQLTAVRDQFRQQIRATDPSVDAALLFWDYGTTRVLTPQAQSLLNRRRQEFQSLPAGPAQEVPLTLIPPTPATPTTSATPLQPVEQEAPLTLIPAP